MQKKDKRVLLVEDNPFDADILQELLDEVSQSNVSLVWVDKLCRAKEILAGDEWDLILLDMNLPDSAGLVTLSKAQEFSKELPIIVLSGLADEAVAIEAVQNGAQDYLVKGQFTGDILLRSIMYAIERKQMACRMAEHLEKTLEMQNQLSAVLGTMSEGLCKIDLSGTIVYMNAAAERLLGIKFEDLSQRMLHNLVHGDQCPGTSGCAYLKCEQLSASKLQIEDVFLSQEFGQLPVEFSSTPLLIYEKITGVVICFRDIRERKLADTRVREFYSSVSHELRTPLTSIKGSLSLIENGVVGEIDAEALELVKVANESCDRLVRLINDLLDIKKIEAGQLVLNREDISPGNLVKKCLEAMKGYAVQNRVHLKVEEPHIEMTPPSIKGDRDRLEQVVLNLVSNAVKFSKQGDIVTVRVESGTTLPLRISVSDQGPGIAPEDISKLFQRFQQLDSSDARCYDGTGLGLAISKALVEQHGGEIGVHSVFGHGSTFWFELPSAV